MILEIKVTWALATYLDGVLCAKLKTKKTQNLCPLFADRFLEVRGSKIANGNQNSSLKM